MKLKAENLIDREKVEKKLGCDLDIIIKYWKKGKKDNEIAESLGIEEWKLKELRLELQQLHHKARIKKGKEEGRK